MAVDKHSQDAMAKLYAEWVSAGVKLSLAGFTATAKILEAAGQSAMSARAKAHAAGTAKAEPAAAAAPEAKAATVTPLKVVPKAETAKVETAVKPDAKAARAQVKAAKPSTAIEEATKPAPATNDLKLISGIGPKLEQMLVRKGITSFAQIAALGISDVAKLDAELNLNGRIQRDDWVGQAVKLAGNVGGQTWQN